MCHIGTFYFNPRLLTIISAFCQWNPLKMWKAHSLLFFFAWLLSKKYCKRKETVLKNTVREISPSWWHAGGALIPSATLVATPTTKCWLHPLRLPLFSSPFNFVESPKGCQFYQQAANRGLKMLRFMSGVMQFWSEYGYIVDFLGIFVNQGFLRAL